MVFETYTTNDYSFHYNEEYNPRRPPQTHNDVYYHRMQERDPNTEPNINPNNKSEARDAYCEFIYSPMLPKPSLPVNEIKGNSVSVSILYYISKWCCCYTA